MTDFSLTKVLLASDRAAFQAATQSTFLSRAAQGRVDKKTLGQWLANDRLYIHTYIHGVGRLLSFLRLPDFVNAENGGDHYGVSQEENDRATSIKMLLTWMIDALVNVHDELGFFVNTATKYGIEINLPTDGNGRVLKESKLEGLIRFESLFASISPPSPSEPQTVLPWLEAAVIFWATEKCYLESWSRVQAHMLSASEEETAQASSSTDADGGALRNDFMPRWTTTEFKTMVDEIGDIIDVAVEQELHGQRGEEIVAEIVKRAKDKWSEVLLAEKAFWPDMEP